MTKHQNDFTDEEIVAIVYYQPLKPGYVWDHGWQEICGYQEVTMQHIAALAQDLWGGRSFRYGYDVPDRQDRKGKPKGKWRKRKDVRLIDSWPYWYMTKTHETGRHVSTETIADEQLGWEERNRHDRY